MSYPASVLADSPVAYYRLGESSGTACADSSGNGHDMTYSGVTLGQAGALSGDADTAVLFGAGYAGLPASALPDPGTGDFAIEFWGKFTDGGVDVVSNVNSANPSHVRFDSGCLGTYLGDTTLRSSTTATNNGAWHHYVITRESGNLKYYIDGSLDHNWGAAGGSVYFSPLVVGALNSGVDFPFVGTLDEVAFYTAALSSTRVAAHYAAGTGGGGGGAATTLALTGPTSGTVGLASTNFTVTPDGTTSSTVTPHTTGSGTFSPSSVTFSGGSSPLNFTYTPTTTAGSPHSISVTTSGSETVTGSPITYAVNAPSAHAYVTQRAGNWSVPSSDPTSPWSDGGTQSGWGSYPGVGDTLTYSHDLACDIDVTVGSDNAGGVPAIQTGSTGAVATLTVASGKTLNCRGDFANPYGTLGCLSLSAGGKFFFQPASGATLKFDVQYVGQIKCNGTSGSRCTFGTDLSRGGNNSYLNIGIRPGLVTAACTDFQNMGSASQPGLGCFVYSVDGPVSITSCTFTNCNFRASSDSGWDLDFTFTDNTFVNSVGYTGIAPHAIALHLAFASGPTTGTRVVQRNTVDLVFYAINHTNTVTSENNFLGGFQIVSGSWSSDDYWHSNFVQFDSQGGVGQCQIGGPFRDCYHYWIDVSSAGNPHWIGLPAATVSVTGSLFEFAGTAANGDILLAGGSGCNLTATGNLVLPNAAGKSSGKLVSTLNMSSGSVTVEHNTACCDSVEGALVEIGEAAATFAGQVPSCRSNLCWAASADTPSSAGGVYVLNDQSVAPALDAVTLTGHNGFWHGDTGTVNAGGSNVSALGYEAIKVTAAGFPSSQVGSGDVSADPQFVDRARKLAAWSTHKGGPGTAADAITRLTADPTLVASDLVPWVSAGYAPTSSAYHNTAHDGTDIGAVPYTAPGGTISSAADGVWSAGATWVGGVAPGAGDSAVVHHHVSVTADAVIGDGSATTVLDVTDGTLTVTGAKLTVRGNSTFGQANAGNLVARLVVSNSVATPGGIEFDGGAGVRPVATLRVDTLVTFTGTSSARCFVRTKAGTAGLPAAFVGDPAALRGPFYQFTYTDLARLGDATMAGVSSNAVGAVASGVNAVSLAHCTVDSCGALPYPIIDSGDSTVSLTDTTWTNPQDPQYLFRIGNNNVALTTGTRLINGCRCFGPARPTLDGPQDFTITYNYFGASLYANKGGKWAAFFGNLVRKQVIGESQTAGDVTGNFLLCDPADESGSSPETFIHLANDIDLLVDGNVFQYVGTRTTNWALGVTENGLTAHTQTITRNLILPNGSETSAALGGLTANRTDAGTPLLVIENNTVPVGTYVGATAGQTVGQKAGSILSYRSNIFWRTGGAHAGAYALRNDDPSPQVDVVTADNCDYNGWFGLAPVPGGTWSDVADGTVYSTPMSGATAPGAHDVANVDPQFSDPTRNLQTWDAALGGAGTVASAIARVQGDLSLVTSSLLPWVKAGFVPQNPAYRAAAHDDGTIGAVPYVAPVTSPESATTRPAGVVSPDLTGFNFFAAGAWWQELGRSVTGDAVSSQSAAIIALFAENGVPNLNSFGSGSTVNGGNSSYTQPYNVVPHDQPLKTLTFRVGGYGAESDPGPVPFFPEMAFQSWPFRDGDGAYWIRGTAALTGGSPNVVGTGSHFTADVLAGDQVCFGTETDTYTVLSVTDDTHLTLTANYTGSTHSGDRVGGPWNRPCPSGETAIDGLDRHGLVAQTDAAGTGLARLWEYYGVESADAGVTYIATGGAQWDMTTGATRPDGNTTATAGGLPALPMLLTYPAAAAGAINHAIRCTIGANFARLFECVWPARHAPGAGLAGQGLPMGARLRLKASWLAANASGFTPTIQNVLTAMHTYGLIVDDIGNGGVQIDGTNDDRWTYDELQSLSTVPMTAFEVLEMSPQLSFTGPTSGPAGVAQEYTVSYLIDDNDNFHTDLVIDYSTDGGVTWPDSQRLVDSLYYDHGNQFVDDTHRGPFTLNFTPPADGDYVIRVRPSAAYWLAPTIAFTAGAAAPGATSYTLTGPSSGTVGVASADFTVTPDGTWSGAVTPHTSGSGAFTPSSLSWSGESSAKTFKYTPATTAGTPHQISTTASPTLGSDPAAVSYTVVPGPATSYTLTGPSSGPVNAPSAPFTVTPDSVWTGVVTPHSTGAGSFTPATLSWSNESGAKTFEYTPTSASGSPHSVSTTAGPVLGTDPAPVSYTVTDMPSVNLAVVPSFVQTSAAATLLLLGTGTSWTAGTPSDLFVLSGLSGAVLSNVIVYTDFMAVATLTTPAASGSVSITDSATGGTATVTVTAQTQPGDPLAVDISQSSYAPSTLAAVLLAVLNRDILAVDVGALAASGTYTGGQLGAKLSTWAQLGQLAAVADVAPSASAFRLGSNTSDQAGAYVSQTVLFISGPLKGERRTISAYAGAPTRQVSVSSPFSNAPADGDLVQIM